MEVFMSPGEQSEAMGKIIARALADDAFKAKLLSDATAILKEEGVVIPEGFEVRAVENTDKVFHLVIPRKPSVDKGMMKATGADPDEPHFCYIA
jgi:hypothetical protein